MPAFKDLTEKSIATLRPHICYWAMKTDEPDFFLSLDINDQLPIVTSGCLRPLAGFAIHYAVLLDDKNLIADLFRLGVGASLEYSDEFNFNKTPLELAIEYGRADIAKILLLNKAWLPGKVSIPSSNPCRNPFTFFWAAKETVCGRQANYRETEKLMQNPFS